MEPGLISVLIVGNMVHLGNALLMDWGQIVMSVGVQMVWMVLLHNLIVIFHRVRVLIVFVKMVLMRESVV